MSIPTNIFLTINGGLGDILSEYFMTDEWKILSALKEKYPQTHIKLALFAHSTSAKDIFEHHPHLDSVDILPSMHFHLTDKFNSIIQYAMSSYPGWTYIGQLWDYWDKLERRPQVLYLSDKDKEQVNLIQRQGKYIILHPFAGTPDRLVINSNTYEIIANRIISELDYNVVIIGNNHSRTIQEAETDRINKASFTEDFQLQGSRIINLINKVNYRITAQLSMNANGYIGNYSGPIVAAWAAKIRNVVYIPLSHKHMADTSTAISWPTVRCLSFTKPIYPENISSKEIVDQTISHIKGNKLCCLTR